MDLRFGTAVPTEAERDAVDAVLGPPEAVWVGAIRGRSGDELRTAAGGHAQRSRRHLLLPALHALTDRVGWISPGGLDYVCRRLTVAPAEAYGVATFYDLFSLVERPERAVHVCEDLACLLAGADVLVDQLPDGDATWRSSPCLGMCERAPAAFVTHAGEPAERRVVAPVDVASLTGLVAGAPLPAPRWDAAASVVQRGEPALVLLGRVGVVDPTSLESHLEHGGGVALARAIELGPAAVRAEVEAAGLVGRGGAAFPAAVKWNAVAAHPRTDRHLVINADESEPGTFKDRVLLEGDPFTIVEAATIAALACGIEHGIVYLRGEYPVAEELLVGAIAQCEAAGLLGDDVAGSGRRFVLELRRGAGAYICGEETALFNSIEGQRGEPRSKPPFPTDVGLFGRPTLVNNVETLANVVPIVREGGEAFASVGHASSTGTKLFCVSGSVRRPGLVEVPFGATLAEVLDIAGGLADGAELQAVLLGGAAGAFVGPDQLDLELTLEATRTAGVTLGSGVVLVIDTSVPLLGMLERIAAFFRHESCGQCVPCRVGTVRQHEALQRLRSGTVLGGYGHEAELLDEVGRAMRDASICGLGQTAWNAIESALRLLDLPDDVPDPQEDR